MPKKKTAKELKPFKAEEIVNFPCGGDMVVNSVTYRGGKLVFLSLSTYSATRQHDGGVRLSFAKESFTKLRELVRRLGVKKGKK